MSAKIPCSLLPQLPPPPKNDNKRKKVCLPTRVGALSFTRAQGKKGAKRKEPEQFDWMTVEAGVDGEQVVTAFHPLASAVFQ